MDFKEKNGRDGRRTVLTALCALPFLLLACCGGGSAPTGVTPGAQLDAGNSVIGIDIHYSPTAITIVEGRQITSDGGEITAQRLKLDIPEDAVNPGDTVVFTVMQDNSVGAGATLADADVADRVASFGNTYVVLAELEPGAGEYPFVTGINIAISYDYREIPHGFTEAHLTVFTFDGEHWRNVGGIVDPAAKTMLLHMNRLAPLRLAALKTDAVELQSIRVDPAQITLNKGETRLITATGYYSNFSAMELTTAVEWELTNPAVAGVYFDQDGALHVLALRAGTTQLTARHGDKHDSITVIVIDLEPPGRVGKPTVENTRLGNSLRISWTLVDDDDVDRYEVYYATTSFTAPDQAVLGGTVGPLETSLVIDGLINETQYYVGALAVDISGNVGQLSELERGAPYDLTPPDAVTQLTASGFAQFPGRVALDWNGYEAVKPDDLAYFLVFMGENEFNNVQSWPAANPDPIQVAADVFDYTFNGLVSGREYSFTVLAVDRSANSQPGNVTVVTATPH